MVEVSLTVGKLDASLALLLTKDHHLIEFPTILLPNGVKAGSIISIKCEQDLETEAKEAKQFQSIQDEILNTFGQNLPQPPVLKIKNVTQTSCVLEWDPLELGTASVKNLILFKDGKKLGAIPQPLTSRTTKLSGLPIDKTFKFQLRFDTTAGIYSSEVIEVTTHKMTDLSGITVCLGEISPNDQFSVDDIQDTLKNMGAHYPTQDKIKVDTTHFICTRENKQNPEFLKASEMNIPIVRPEWLKACERERRIVGVRDFYVKDCVLPDIFAKNYWGSTNKPQHHQAAAAPVAETPKPQETEIVSKKESELPAVPVSETPAATTEAEEPRPEIPTIVETKADEPEPITQSSEAKPEIAADVESAGDFKEVSLEQDEAERVSTASETIENGIETSVVPTEEEDTATAAIKEAEAPAPVESEEPVREEKETQVPEEETTSEAKPEPEAAEVSNLTETEKIAVIEEAGDLGTGEPSAEAHQIEATEAAPETVEQVPDISKPEDVPEAEVEDADEGEEEDEAEENDAEEVAEPKAGEGTAPNAGKKKKNKKKKGKK